MGWSTALRRKRPAEAGTPTGPSTRDRTLVKLTIPVPRGLRRRDEDPVAWEFLEQRLRLAEVGRQHVPRIARDPERQVDRLVMPRVETDQDAAGLGADILDGMAI